MSAVVPLPGNYEGLGCVSCEEGVRSPTPVLKGTVCLLTRAGKVP